MGQLLKIEGGKKDTVKINFLWLKKLIHFFSHDWTAWTEGEVINIFRDDDTTKLPIRRELRQERKCNVCNVKQVKRLDY